ncbi:uncharacterized protein LOC135204937 isoform X1 [Macrobrachium nipponense]|uniref:uncharacterized protein LOC135204937 isoform X1 n=1 Tax=Macrobrachium nipponense TaxID=159736 RepID=UPI0030C8C47F
MSRLPLIWSIWIFTSASVTLAVYMEPPNIKYFPNALGNMISVTGMKMAPSHVFQTLPISSACEFLSFFNNVTSLFMRFLVLVKVQNSNFFSLSRPLSLFSGPCRLTCLSLPTCTACALVSNPGSSPVCQISKIDLLTLTFENSTDAIYSYKETAMKGLVSKLMPDGNLYFVINYWTTFPQQQYWCSRYPGFRLGIFKNRTEFLALIELSMLTGNTLGVDLNDSTGARVWGDGTPFNSTSLGVAQSVGLTMGGALNDGNNYYALSTNKQFFDQPGHNAAYPLCQANHVTV